MLGCVGQRVLRSAHHLRQVVPVHMNRGAPLGGERGPGAERVTLIGCWVSLVVVASVRLGCCGAPLGEGRGPGAGWGHADRLLGESGGCRVVAARAGCWVSLVVVAVVRLGSAAWLLGLSWGVLVGGCLEVHMHHPRQVVLVHMPNTGRIGSVRQLGIRCINCCPF